MPVYGSSTLISLKLAIKLVLEDTVVLELENPVITPQNQITSISQKKTSSSVNKTITLCNSVLGFYSHVF